MTRHQYGISALVPQKSFRIKPVVVWPIVGCFLRPSSHFHLKPRTEKQIAHVQRRDQLSLQGILESPTIFNSQAGLGYDFTYRLWIINVNENFKTRTNRCALYYSHILKNSAPTPKNTNFPDTFMLEQAKSLGSPSLYLKLTKSTPLSRRLPL